MTDPEPHPPAPRLPDGGGVLPPEAGRDAPCAPPASPRGTHLPPGRQTLKPHVPMRHVKEPPAPPLGRRPPAHGPGRHRYLIYTKTWKIATTVFNIFDGRTQPLFPGCFVVDFSRFRAFGACRGWASSALPNSPPSSFSLPPWPVRPAPRPAAQTSLRTGAAKSRCSGPPLLTPRTPFASPGSDCARLPRHPPSASLGRPCRPRRFHA